MHVKKMQQAPPWRLGASVGTGAAAADEYDDALRCLLLIEFAKIDYEAGNIDALRDAGNLFTSGNQPDAAD
jgi:hypothetical protein